MNLPFRVGWSLKFRARKRVAEFSIQGLGHRSHVSNSGLYVP